MRTSPGATLVRVIAMIRIPVADMLCSAPSGSTPQNVNNAYTTATSTARLSESAVVSTSHKQPWYHVLTYPSFSVDVQHHHATAHPAVDQS
jgi:hypothetical protein